MPLVASNRDLSPDQRRLIEIREIVNRSDWAESLAVRWHCSSTTVRRLVQARLLGTAMRTSISRIWLSATAVAHFETTHAVALGMCDEVTLTPSQVRKRYRIHRSSLSRWIRNYTLPHFQSVPLTKIRRILLSQLLLWERQMKITPWNP